MIQCEYDPATLLCRKCGHAAKRLPTYRRCQVDVSGLGDMVARGLAAVGITKERVEAVLGGPCGCSGRQQKLNELGRMIGIGMPENQP